MTGVLIKRAILDTCRNERWEYIRRTTIQAKECLKLPQGKKEADGINPDDILVMDS